MDIIDKVKKLLKPIDTDTDPVHEKAQDAYDVVKAMSDDELKKRYLGKDPSGVPREAQEELYMRFVQPHAHYNCSKCYGRGWTAWNPALHQLEPCLCLQRVIRTEVAKENQAYLYDPSGNKMLINN